MFYSVGKTLLYSIAYIQSHVHCFQLLKSCLTFSFKEITVSLYFCCCLSKKIEIVAYIIPLYENVQFKNVLL